MSRAEYLVVKCTIPSSLEDELPELMAPYPVLGCQVEPLTESQSRLRVFLSSEDAGSAAEVSTTLANRGAHDPQRMAVETRDWLDSYRRQVVPFEVGQMWWVDPHPDEPTAAPSGRVRLVMEPRMAFGSGSHETTRLMLTELERTPVENRSVLDVGTGSGILAMAAERIGARRVLGLDVDVQAILVASQLARQQEWEVNASLLAAPIDALGPASFDLVLCNMIPSNFLPLLPEISRLVDPRGLVVLSGILADQRDEVSSALEDVGLQPQDGLEIGEWISLRAVSRAG